jgi:hypothetical protein
MFCQDCELSNFLAMQCKGLCIRSPKFGRQLEAAPTPALRPRITIDLERPSWLQNRFISSGEVRLKDAARTSPTALS